VDQDVISFLLLAVLYAPVNAMTHIAVLPIHVIHTHVLNIISLVINPNNVLVLAIHLNAVFPLVISSRTVMAGSIRLQDLFVHLDAHAKFVVNALARIIHVAVVSHQKQTKQTSFVKVILVLMLSAACQHAVISIVHLTPS